MFGAEVTGIDFSEPVSDAVFEEILAAITKVRCSIHAINTIVAQINVFSISTESSSSAMPNSTTTNMSLLPVDSES